MGLRFRLLLFVCLTTLCLITGIHWVSSGQLLDSYADLERSTATDNVDRAYRGFSQLVSDLHTRSTDWSNSDDAYLYMADHDESHVAAILADESIANMRLDTVIYLDNGANIVRSIGIPRNRNVRAPDPETVIRLLNPVKVLANGATGRAGLSGVLKTPIAPLMISVRPIHGAAGHGAQRGWLLFGRYYDSAEMANMAARTRLNVSSFDPASRTLPKDCQAVVRKLEVVGTSTIMELNQQRLGGYTLIRDVHNNGALLLRINMSREIFARGIASSNQLVQLVILTAVLFAAVLALSLETFILRRLSSLSSQVERVGSHDNNARVRVSGRDELARLGERINGMLDALAGGANMLRASEERLRVYNETLESTVQKRTQELEDRNRRMRIMNSVLEHAVEGIATLDPEGRYQQVNSACASLFDVTPDDLIGIHWQETIEPVSHAAATESCRIMRMRGKDEVELTGTRADGTSFHLHVTMVADPEAANGSFYWFMKDVSERKAFEAHIAYQAFHDALTGLPNRSLFLNRLQYAHERLRRENSPMAVIFIDLDNFKLVNDSFGHEAGDRLLVEAAERLKAFANENITVARLAGDEFTLLLESVESVDCAAAIAERVVNTLHATVDVGVGEFYLTASAGVAYTNEVMEQPDNLLRDADTAMYHAKTNGKSAFAVFDSLMYDSLSERMDIEAGLRFAIERGELRVYYQPLVDLVSGKLAGVEALMRWDRPGKGLVLPGRFLAVAEDTGLIVPIGHWVLENACTQAEAWRLRHGAETPLTLNVNLSGKQLQRPDAVEQVAAILERTGLPPHMLKLEITESVMMEDVDDAIRKMLKLKALGVKLALDDFGTGYSSMANLHCFPLHTVKIDRSFVQRLSENAEEAASVIRAIVMLSKSLALEVTGEGVENIEHVGLLRRLGCDLGQGYYFAQPLDAAEIESRLNESRVVFLTPAIDVPTAPPDSLRVVPAASQRMAA